jgi:hypothetical protein
MEGFSLWGSFPQKNVESSVTHNHTEFHGFQRLATFPIASCLHSQGERGSHSLSPDSDAEVERGGVPCARTHSQEMTQCQDTNPRLSKRRDSSLPFSFLSLIYAEVDCGTIQVAFYLV